MPLPQDFGPPLEERELISEEQRNDWDKRTQEAEQVFGICIVLARDFTDDAPAREGELPEARRARLAELLAISVRQLDYMRDVENEERDEVRIAREESGLPYWDREARRRRRQQERREAHRRRLDGIARAREEHQQQQGDGLGGEINPEGEEGSQEGEDSSQEEEESSLEGEDGSREGDDSQETENDSEGSDDNVEESEDDAEEPNGNSEEADESPEEAGESPEGAGDDPERADDERLPGGLSPISEEHPSSARPARSTLSRIPWLQNRLRRRRARVEADAGHERGRSMSEEPRSTARRPSVSSVRSFLSSPSPSA